MVVLFGYLILQGQLAIRCVTPKEKGYETNRAAKFHCAVLTTNALCMAVLSWQK